jgi:uncharacterized protein
VPSKIPLAERLQSESGAREVSVRAYKYDGTEHRRWTARESSVEGSLVIMTGAFEKEINHPLLGKICRGTTSVEHYWTDRWYSVFRFTEPSGELRNYYCNVNAPPSYDGRVLTFVDLDIDILVTPDFEFQVLDEQEFAENALRFNYPVNVLEMTHAAVAELIELIENRQFPFA